MHRIITRPLRQRHPVVQTQNIGRIRIVIINKHRYIIHVATQLARNQLNGLLHQLIKTLVADLNHTHHPTSLAAARPQRAYWRIGLRSGNFCGG